MTKEKQEGQGGEVLRTEASIGTMRGPEKRANEEIRRLSCGDFSNPLEKGKKISIGPLVCVKK
jgi:hypothetical protein